MNKKRDPELEFKLDGNSQTTLFWISKNSIAILIRVVGKKPVDWIK